MAVSAVFHRFGARFRWFTKTSLPVLGGFLRYFFGLLLCVCVVRVLNGGNVISFTSLLQMLSQAPAIDSSFISTVTTNFADLFPDWLSWLGSVFDFFTNIFAFGLYTGTAGLNILIYFTYFLRWVFI